MEIKEVGQEARFQVAAVDRVQGQYGEQYVITAANNDVLYMPVASLDRQLEHMGLGDPSELENQWIRVYRAPNPRGKPFWNIEILGQGSENTPATRRAIAQTPARQADAPAYSQTGGSNAPVQQRRGEVPLSAPVREVGRSNGQVEQKPLALLYMECFDFMREALGKWMSLPGGPEAIIAATATLFIQACKHTGPVFPAKAPARPVVTRTPQQPPPPSDQDFDPAFGQEDESDLPY